MNLPHSKPGHAATRSAASTKRYLPRPWLAITLLAVLGGGVLAVVFRPEIHPQSLLAQQLQADLARPRPRLQADQLAQIDRQLPGDEGTDVIVQALASSQASHALAAQPILIKRLNSWQLLPRHVASQRVAHLARRLHEQQPKMSPSAQRFVAELGEEVLNWNLDTQAIDSLAVIDHCAALIQSAPADKPPTTQFEPKIARRLVQKTDTAAWNINEEAVPGGALPVAPVEVPSLPDTLLNPAALQRLKPGEPHRLPPLRPIEEPAPLTTPPASRLTRPPRPGDNVTTPGTAPTEVQSNREPQLVRPPGTVQPYQVN